MLAVDAAAYGVGPQSVPAAPRSTPFTVAFDVLGKVMATETEMGMAKEMEMVTEMARATETVMAKATETVMARATETVMTRATEMVPAVATVPATVLARSVASCGCVAFAD